MIKLYFSFCIIFYFIGCTEDEIIKSSFPEIVNPLDKEDEFSSVFSGATDFSNLVVTNDNDVENYHTLDGANFSGWVKKTYEGGSVGYLFYCKNGKQDGLHTSWYSNGKKMVERSWKNGLRDGPYQIWTDAGLLESRGYHEKNALHGQIEEFYSNGKLKSKSQYIYGFIDTFEGWKPDGSVCPISSIKGGTGIKIHYREDGTIDRNETFKDGDFDYGTPNELNEAFIIEKPLPLLIDERKKIEFQSPPVEN